MMFSFSWFYLCQWLCHPCGELWHRMGADWFANLRFTPHRVPVVMAVPCCLLRADKERLAVAINFIDIQYIWINYSTALQMCYIRVVASHGTACL